MADKQQGERVDDSYKYSRAVRKGRPDPVSFADVREPFGIVYPQPGHPTGYAPGSVGKFFVIMCRARRMESLYHPYDARYPDDPRDYFFGILDPNDRERIIKEQTRKSNDAVDDPQHRTKRFGRLKLGRI